MPAPAPIRLKFSTPEEMKMPLSRDDQIALLTNLVVTMVKSIAEHPDKVNVSSIVGEHNLVLEIALAESDIGLVLGREAATTAAMRTVLHVASKKTNFKVHIDILHRRHGNG